MYWGVIRDQQWDSAGLPDNEAEAPAKNAQAGPASTVRYGRNRVGTFGFMVLPPIPESRSEFRLFGRVLLPMSTCRG